MSDPPEEEPLQINSGRTETSRRSEQAKALRILYPGQITYSSAQISGRLVDKPTQLNVNPNTPEAPLSLARFTSTRVAHSHIHMVQKLRILESNMDNERDDEPNSLNQAMHRTDWLKWKDVIQAEYDSLIENDIWELTSIPENRHVITGQCCFKLKKDRNGQILKYKTRWVAHGSKQEKGVDLVKIFAAVVKPMSYKCLFGFSVKWGYKIRQMDVVTAFLYGFLDEIIYIKQPHLFEPTPELVCCLRKALYRLKQAPQV